MKNEDRSAFLEWKPPIHDHRRVFQAALMAAKRFHKKQKMYQRMPDSNLAGKLLLFQLQGTGGSVIQKYLEIYGCPDIAHVSDESQLFDIIASIPVQGIVFWYASDARQSIDVLHRLHANRQLRRRPLMVVYPGEEALTSLKAVNKPFLYDCLEELPYSRLEFADKLEAWFARAEDPANPRSALMNVRTAIRTLAKGGGGDLSEDSLRATLKPVLTCPQGEFWIDCELASFFLAVKNWQKADQSITKLEDKFGDTTLLPLILRANLHAAQGRGLTASLGLIDQIRQRKLSEDQMLQIGQQLSRWQEKAALEKFLLYWHEHAGLERGYAFAFLVAKHLQRMKDYYRSYDYLKHVIAKAPFRWEFLMAMAENRLKMRDYRMAEHYWIVAKHHPYADPIMWAIGLIRAHYGQKRIRYADGLLVKMLKKYPQDPRLLKIKKVYVDDRLDQFKASS